MQSLSTWMSLESFSNTLWKVIFGDNGYSYRFWDIDVWRYVGIMTRTAGYSELEG